MLGDFRSLEVLHSNGEFVLSRGRGPADQPAFLVVAPAVEHPEPATLRRLEHAYALRDVLGPTWATRPVALIQDDGRPTLLLEDPGDDVLDPLPDHPLNLTQFLRIAIALAAAIGRFHGRDLIHKDIKPF